MNGKPQKTTVERVYLQELKNQFPPGLPVESENRQLEIFDLLRVNLKVFEGPLDLLLDLIRKKKMDIGEISLSEICEPYLEQLDLMEAFNMEVAIEFLDIASTLILIKSRTLLPQNTTAMEDEDIMDTEQQLRQKLIEYQKFQTIAEGLNRRELLGRDMFGRPDVVEAEIENSVELFEDLSIYSLIKAYRQLIIKKGYHKPHEIVAAAYSLEEKILAFLKVFQSGEIQTLPDLCPRNPTKPEIIISLMAILELTRLFLLQIQQMKDFDVLHCIPNSNVSDYLMNFEVSAPNRS
ncbi:MAG: segregation/condensation protein A [Deltaproteobacteria bacterium]|jgi:segregation and condensation protein A|nr:segregation/condensation protein A [Deltaproteobacteria bacterium]MBT4087417.1 segregation/condensation protein A [Deltaproteobacteria bacterium]MBT4263581.1 segregation/condensation protein A [Deltaproteobacteria bacterium]MBT4644340.1 segregation/condensation protein A [Deltaproteobacteria bacterium]MBT6500421.1 segregation/condensation protein A [Deltaproteobacteria bacterium]